MVCSKQHQTSTQQHHHHTTTHPPHTVRSSCLVTLFSSSSSRRSLTSWYSFSVSFCSAFSCCISRSSCSCHGYSTHVWNTSAVTATPVLTMGIHSRALGPSGIVAVYIVCRWMEGTDGPMECKVDPGKSTGIGDTTARTTSKQRQASQESNARLQPLLRAGHYIYWPDLSVLRSASLGNPTPLCRKIR